MQPKNWPVGNTVQCPVSTDAFVGGFGGSTLPWAWMLRWFRPSGGDDDLYLSPICSLSEVAQTVLPNQIQSAHGAGHRLNMELDFQSLFGLLS
jgi:hypothetical protein